MRGFEVVTRDAEWYCAHPVVVSADDRSIVLPAAFWESDTYMAEHGEGRKGRAVLRYKRTLPDGRLEVEAGYLTTQPVAGGDRMVLGMLLPGSYAVARSDGPFAELEAVARALVEKVEAEGLELDVTRGPDGEVWGCRYDLHIEPPVSGPTGMCGAVAVSIRLKDPVAGARAARD
jgi:hypothetical protein